MGRKIKFHIGQHDKDQEVKQDINYFYAFNSHDEDGFIDKKTYESLLREEDRKLIIAMNYTEENPLGYIQFYPPVGAYPQGKTGYNTLSIYKREIWESGGELLYHRVINDSPASKISDYNISNGRTYEYVIYPHSQNVDQPEEIRAIIETNWNFWSITELHPTQEKNIYNASPDDVWLLKYNVAPQDFKHDFAKTQQDNLGTYPVFARGKKNIITSGVSAYLGSEIIPFNWVTNKKKPIIDNSEIKWVNTFSGRDAGGYHEKMPFSQKLSSNDKIDMINKWREICYSGNPKLIKDMKGQKFLVQIVEDSSQTNYNFNRMPDTISFSWVQIGNADDIQVFEEK